MRRAPPAIWVGAALAIAGAALAAIVTVVNGDFGESDGRAVIALASVLLCASAAVAAVYLLESRFQLLGAVLLVAAGVELVSFQLGIWKAEFGDGSSNDYIKLVPITFAWAIATVLLATLPLIAVDRWLVLAAAPVVGAFGLVGATIATVMIWRDNDSQAWGKTLAVLAILMVAGYLLTPVARRLAASQEERT
jgi:surface polysaccharide O-acyltransferase-like enzyme